MLTLFMLGKNRRIPRHFSLQWVSIDFVSVVIIDTVSIPAATKTAAVKVMSGEFIMRMHRISRSSRKISGKPSSVSFALGFVVTSQISALRPSVP